MKRKNISRIIITLIMVFMVAASVLSASVLSITARDTTRIDTVKDTVQVVDMTTDTTADEIGNTDTQIDDSNTQSIDDTLPIDDNPDTQPDDTLPADDTPPTQTNLDPIIVVDDVRDAPIDIPEVLEDTPLENETIKEKTPEETTEKPIEAINKTIRKKPMDAIKIEDANVLTLEEIIGYKQELAVEGDELELKTARKLIEQRRENRENYNNIMNIVKESKTEEKELIASELADMDDNFVAKLRKRSQSNKEDVEKQISNYVESLEQQKPALVIFDTSIVLDIFNNEKSFENILAEFG